MGRVFANGPGDLCSIPKSRHTKDIEIVLDTSLLNTQQYKVRIKGRVGANPREGVCAPPPCLAVVGIEKGEPLWLPSKN